MLPLIRGGGTMCLTTQWADGHCCSLIKKSQCQILWQGGGWRSERGEDLSLGLIVCSDTFTLQIPTFLRPHALLNLWKYDEDGFHCPNAHTHDTWCTLFLSSTVSVQLLGCGYTYICYSFAVCVIASFFFSVGVIGYYRHPGSTWYHQISGVITPDLRTSCSFADSSDNPKLRKSVVIKFI